LASAAEEVLFTLVEAVTDEQHEQVRPHAADTLSKALSMLAPMISALSTAVKTWPGATPGRGFKARSEVQSTSLMSGYAAEESLLAAFASEKGLLRAMGVLVIVFCFMEGKNNKAASITIRVLYTVLELGAIAWTIKRNNNNHEDEDQEEDEFDEADKEREDEAPDRPLTPQPPAAAPESAAAPAAAAEEQF